MISSSKRVFHEGEIDIPGNVKIGLEGGALVAAGPLGIVKKDFSKIPVELSSGERKLHYRIYVKGRKGSALVYTIRKIIGNLFTGVLKGFTYRMKVYYRHFPFTVEVKGRQVIIKNFTGERGYRRAEIIGDTKVEIQGDDIMLKGLNKEEVGQTAANIQQTCKIKIKDPRIFIDGIYVYSKEEGI